MRLLTSMVVSLIAA
jgi:hypothetical protein